MKSDIVKVVGYSLSKKNYGIIYSMLMRYYQKKKRVSASFAAQKALYKLLYSVTIIKTKQKTIEYSQWTTAPDLIFDRLAALKISMADLYSLFPEEMIESFKKILQEAESGIWTFDLKNGKPIDFVPYNIASEIFHSTGAIDPDNIKEANDKIKEQEDSIKIEEDIVKKITKIAEEFEINSQSDKVILETIASILYNMEKNGVGKDEVNELASLYKLLGIDRASRDEKKDEISSGSIADLSKLYDEYVSSGKWIDLEKKWRLEEIALMLRKLDRKFEVTGEPELTEGEFKALMGITVEEARKLVPNPYDEKYANPEFK